MSVIASRNPLATFGLVLAVTALAAFSNLSQAQETTAPAMKSWQTGLHRTDLVQKDLDATSGREVIQTRVDFEPGVAAPRHSHPGVEVAYVLKGTMQYELEGQPPVTLKAGDSLFIPEGVAHLAKNIGKDQASELATYVVHKGKSLVELKP
ncbi:cupin domain-containing protein [Pseudomonas gingeri]